MKKLLAGLLAALMIFSAAPMTGLAAQAEIMLAAASERATEDFSYQVLEDGTAEITGYTGSAEELTIPSEIDGYLVTSIGDMAFYDCTGLSDVAIPSSVTSIGISAFSGCIHLKSVTLGSGLKSLGHDAFSGTAITEVTIPKSVTDIEGNGTIFRSPFSKTEFLKKVTFEDGVETILPYILRDCTSVEKIVIPDSTKTIGNYAFSGCAGLKDITIPGGVTTIDSGAFYGCSILESVTLGSSLKSLGRYVFSGTSITEITIPKSVTSMSGPFNGADSLKKVIFEGGIETIPSGALENCTSVEEVVIPNSVKTIDSYAFSGCTGLKDITIPNSVTEISRAAFQDCIGLTSVIIPDSVTTIDYYAFEDCINLKSVTFGSGLKSLYTGAFSGTAITEVTIPKFVTYMNSPFSRATTLQKIAFEDDIKTIPAYALRNNTSVEEVVIPDSVKDISIDAFFGCTGLKNIYYTGFETQWNDISIASGNEDLLNATIHYKAHEHAYVEVQKEEPTCTQPGEILYQCTICGESFTEVLEPLGHSSGEWVIEQEPTCVTDGNRAKYCTVCNALVEEETLPATGHSYQETVVEPTCTTQGYTLHQCSVCGASYQDHFTDALGHHVGEWVIEREPTCTVDGIRVKRCTVCHVALETETLPSGHQYTSTVIAPTCTEQGYTEHICQVCGFSYRDQYVDELGHRLGEWITKKEPTCTTDGERVKYCTVCNELLAKEPIPAIGHDYSHTVVPPTCTEQGYTQHDCKNCGDTYRDSFVEATGHTESAWVIQKEPTCTANGNRYKYCTVCDAVICSEVLPALGHSYQETVIAPDCTHGGYTQYTCERCGHYYRDHATDPLGHSFGEWVTDKQATVLVEGAKHRECSVCGFVEKVVIPKTEIDLSETEEYGLCNFTVVNAQTREPIQNASIYIETENEGECTLQTDAAGKVSQILPVGTLTISAYADGCLTRNLNIEVKPGEQDIPVIGLSDKPTYEAELTSHLMTYEEIIEAGIDVTAPGNNHVYKYELKLEFEAEIDWGSLYYYMNGNGEIIGGGTSDGSGALWVSNGKGAAGSGHFFIPDSGDGEPVTIYPVSERFYLIIRGEVKWLKEMFDVEMLIINNSMTDTLENLTATLTLPDGLSLAQMVEEQQALTQHIDRIAEGQSETVHWYVRGDKAGSYGISARLQGTIMPFEEEIDEIYEGKNQIQVWAGDALHLHFEFPNAAYYGEDYPVTVTLTNVSDITLYNVSHKIQIVQGMEYYYSDGTSKKKIETSGWYSEGVKEFKPGDQIIIEASVNIFFESERMEAKLQSLIGLIDGMEQLYNGFKAIQAATDILGAMIGCVSSCVKAIDNFLTSPSLLPDTKLSLFQSLYRSISDLALSYSTSGSSTLDSAIRLSNTGLSNTLKAITDDPAAWLEASTVDDIKRVISEVNSLAGQASSRGTTSREFNIFDSLRTAISAIPIRFALQSVIMTEDEHNTTSIPWSYSVSEAGPQYFGVSNVSGYVSSLVRGAAAQMYDDLMPGYTHLMPGLDDPFNYDEAVRVIQATEDEIALFKAKDATGEVSYKAWVEPNSPKNTYSRMVKTEESAFILACDNDTAVLENGVLTFTGDGMISVTPTTLTGGTLYVEDSEGNLYTFQIEVVPQHTCEAGEWETIFSPTDEYDGFAVKCCKTCGEIMEIKLLSHEAICESHTFSDWSVEEEATCSTPGIQTRTCTTCGYVESKFTAVTENHSVADWSVVTEPTCTTEGLKKGVCQICGAEITESIPKLTHEADENAWIIVKEPTETEDGLKVLKCKYCGEVLKEEVIPATGSETDPEVPEKATLTLTLDGQAVEGDVAYVKLPSVLMMYKNHSATLGFTFDQEVEVASVNWSYASWSVDSPEANIESPTSAETVIRPNGKGIGARSTWVTLTVTDVEGNTYQQTVKVRFYKWDWQRK